MLGGYDEGMSGEQLTAVVAGASGFLGPKVVRALRSDGYRVLTIGRADADATWDDWAAVERVVDGSDLLVNLAGKSVGCRYTDVNWNEILRSRTATTQALHDAVAAAAAPPALWLNASTGTIYRYAMDRPQDETTGELGSGFSVDVARNWESTFFAGHLPGTRRIALRMAIVIGDGPATRMLKRAAALGAGGPNLDGWCPPHFRYRGIGPDPSGDGTVPQHRSHGRQRFSWIHIDDVIAAMLFIRDQGELEGPVNLATPTASDNRTLMAAVRHQARVPFGLPTLRWMLEIGMIVLRNESELVLKSRWVHPQKLVDAGFEFTHTELDEALRS